MDTTAGPYRIEQGVLDVLAGTALPEAASRIPMTPVDLADAIEVYRAAGAAALNHQASGRGWHQVRLQFPDPHTAEQVVATHLRPALLHAEAAGLVSSWWFIRKAQWRLRCLPGDGVPTEKTRIHVEHVLDDLRDRGHISHWCEALYEPEIYAFGGAEAMDVAHRLFHHDSHCILDYLDRHDNAPAGRRELSILLCSCLMRAAGQDWYEQGDIWARIANNRIDDSRVSSTNLRRTKPQLHRLMSVDAGPESMPVRHGQLQFAAAWVEEFNNAGKALGSLAQHGMLDRGVRDILAHHVMFHWNRMGIPASTQASLAKMAQEVVLET